MPIPHNLDSPPRCRLHKHTMPLSHASALTIQIYVLWYSRRTRAAVAGFIQHGITHKRRGATLHERSESDRAPEDALRRIVRPIVTRQHLTPASILVLPRVSRFPSPRQATRAATNPSLTLLRHGIKHDTDHRLPDHAANGTRRDSGLRG